MKLLMLKDEVERLAYLFASVVGQSMPEAKSKDRDPVHVKNGVATIKIKGPLYPKRNSWLDYWEEDYAVYSEIISDVAEAQYNGAKQIDFEIDSPGGYVDGLYDAMKAIASASVPTRTIAGDTLASAAYMLASQTGEIIAESEVSAVGSVGIATAMYVSDRIVDITNSDSRNKRPDVTTEEGKKVVEEELDDFYQVYAEMIAAGRKTTVDKVKRDYGQGAVMTARTALQKKMIDGISTNNQPAESKAANTIGEKMDPKTLKQEHRATYDAIFEAGKEAGVKKENERVCSHLIAAEGGDIEAAHEAIKNGDEYTGLVKAKHDAYARKQALIQARQDDNPPEINTIGDTAALTAGQDEKDRQAFLANHKGWVVE
jgi:ClpP class serine protease